MTDSGNKTEKKPLTLSSSRLGLKGNAGSGSKDKFSGHRAVTVQVKKKRVITRGNQSSRSSDSRQNSGSGGLSQSDLEARMQALKGTMEANAKRSGELHSDYVQSTAKHKSVKEEEVEDNVSVVVEEESGVVEEVKSSPEPLEVVENKDAPVAVAEPAAEAEAKPKAKVFSSYKTDKFEDDSASKGDSHKAAVRGNDSRRRSGKLTVTQALQQGEEDESRRTRSLASIRRSKEKKRQKAMQMQAAAQPIVRDVVIPESLSVAELANRMAVRGADVVKVLMKMGVMATLNQTIDADTAELVVEDMGHKCKRVSDSDVEIGLSTSDSDESRTAMRAPVVTVMGHVDHGKTSLLDAIRKTDVVAGEAGGITQHIGAYQITTSNGSRITFIDTPGHAAFTEMRARGANVTDIVVLVVAADDGVMEQTVEAINHAKAAKVPVILAINKIDKPDANPDRVRSMLLQHEIVCESMGGDILDVEVSAKTGKNIDKLEETILLQSEMLDLNVNADRVAEGVVIESRLEKGRGSVATVLIQKGTLKVGDIFVAGNEFGKVRALLDDRAKNIQEAGPSVPVEVLGLNGTPKAGDDFVVTESESKAREISEYRQRKARASKAALSVKTMDQMFSNASPNAAKELSVIIKSDVQGSMEAISGSLHKLSTDEVKVNVLHSAVGAITESDITLANASQAIVIGFNVRANAQARDMAKRDGVEIRYYSIIYDVIDDVKAALSGLLSPTVREEYIGNAEIRKVFSVSSIGKIAGCMITMGVVKRGSGVRLLRDGIVIHEGKLKTLKRFKDEVKEVKEGYECGMAFENYNDIKEGDVIECFEQISEQRSL